MEIPASALRLMRRLRDAGYEARLVGGCVRDMLRGEKPQDWDICTSATPDEMLAVFADARVIPTGIRHGTLTVLMDGEGYEVTSYRAESGYADARHPDRVDFVRSIDDDLARRDFTVNAMAWDEQTGLIDRFGGERDLADGILRCVGDPAERFGEDALRILRALRFAARFDFTIEPATAAAIHALKSRLHAVSAERIFAELWGLLAGVSAPRIVREFAVVLRELWPKAEPFADDAPKEPALRLALLLKPAGESALDSLRCESALKKQLRELWTADAPSDALGLQRLALRYGAARAREIAALHGWDSGRAEAALRDSPLHSLRELTVRGDALLTLGYAGADVGAMLDELAEQVLCGHIFNNTESLLAYARRRLVRMRGIAAREALTAEQRAVYSARVCERIRASTEYRNARTVLLYRAVGAELSLDALMLDTGKRFAYPLCIGAGEMLALSPRSSDAWMRGAFGILEPVRDGLDAIPPEELELVLCPCTAFDADGHRMGMGAGYYDRFLPECENAFIVAVAFEAQRTEAIPSEPWDVPMAAVFTEKKRYEPGKDLT